VPEKRANPGTKAPGLRRPDPLAMEKLFEAQDLMYDAFEAEGSRRVALALEALELSPDCADAYVLLADEMATNLDEACALLQEGVAAGERALGPDAFKDDVGEFWGRFETRPYMRAREALAETLWALGRKEEAVEHQRELLRLNSNDNQGIRERQVQCLLWLERHDELDELFATYEEDDGAVIGYTKALAAFRRHGASPQASGLLAEARKNNPHVPDYLSGRKRLPRRLPELIGFGDPSEAIAYAADAKALWKSVPGALAWLDS
jgi:tetratricopeptide (TPR) repeat protein